MSQTLSVAEAKRRFSEIIERVRQGERIVVARRGKPAVALVAPELPTVERSPGRPLGLASFAGALADWEQIDEVVAEIYAARRRARDRPLPRLP